MKFLYQPDSWNGKLSPSVWRVWIEIHDANAPFSISVSPSVWRVWIEITQTGLVTREETVTLRVEGVD